MRTTSGSVAPHRFENRVFGYCECDDPEATIAYQAAAEITERWGKAMLPPCHPEVGEKGLTYLPEIFRLD